MLFRSMTWATFSPGAIGWGRYFSTTSRAKRLPLSASAMPGSAAAGKASAYFSGEASVNSTLSYTTSLACRSLFVAGGSFDHWARSSAMSSGVGSHALFCLFPALYGSAIDLGSCTSSKWSATSRLLCCDTVRSSGARARDLPPGNLACAYSNQAPPRLTGTLPSTRVACAKSGSLAMAALAFSHQAAQRLATTDGILLIDRSRLLWPGPQPITKEQAPRRGTPAPWQRRARLFRTARRHVAAAALGSHDLGRHDGRDRDVPDVPDRRVRARQHLAHGHRDRPLRAVVRLRPGRPRDRRVGRAGHGDRTVGVQSAAGGEAGPRALAGVAVHVDESTRRPGGRRLGLDDELAYKPQL